MASSGFIRWGAIGLLLSGVTWVVLGLFAFVGYLQAIPGREDVVLFIVYMTISCPHHPDPLRTS